MEIEPRNVEIMILPNKPVYSFIATNQQFGTFPSFINHTYPVSFKITIDNENHH